MPITADTMPNCDSFYTRLGSIMEELANAAVAEICKLVDDGYAVLRLEMSRSHEENVALRKKLQLMEMQISHEYTKNSGVVEDSLHCGSGGTQVAVERRKNKSERFKITITEEQTASSLWNQGKKAVHKEEDRDTLHVLLDKEGQPELVLIKEERPEENVCTEDSWEGLPETKSRIKGMETEDGQTNFPVNTETGHAEHTTKHGEHPRTGHTSCEVSREDSVLKAEKERDNTRQRVEYTDSELRTEALDYASSESVPNWRACQFDSLIEPSNRDTLTAEAACTNDAGTDSGSLPLQFVRGSHMNGSELFDKSLDPSTHGKACPKKKHFLCNYCGKDFARKNVLETHQRIHTGEKPFGCTQCEKRFSDSSNLKKHQSVHTGEKPFVCMQCGMRFSDSSSRKRHQSVHTGNKPFGCTQCGKRFTRLCHLKRHHQQIHMWPVPFEADSWCDTLKDTISKFTCS